MSPGHHEPRHGGGDGTHVHVQERGPSRRESSSGIALTSTLAGLLG